MVKFFRGLASLFCFFLFGLGGLILSFFLFLIPFKKTSALKLVVFSWKIMAGLFRLFGLIRCDCSRLKEVRGCVLVANHPSLIDVLLLSVFIPRTFSVAKHALRKNIFVGRIVRSVFLSDDEHLLNEAQPLLDAGYNILIFPEGTRSPAKKIHPFKRGAVQLALRTHAPIQPVSIGMSNRILGKEQKPWEMGAKPVLYTFTSLEQIIPQENQEESPHQAASRYTKRLSRLFSAALELDKSE